MLVQMFSVMMCLAVASASSLRPPTPTEVQECPEFCNEIYEPVCGSDGRTYDNECFLLIASCLNPDIVVQSEGRCGPECLTACLADYAPVCGSDGKTYSNACALSVASCRSPSDNIATVYDGECDPVDECFGLCPAIYDPVCGNDGITYGSACALAFISCKNPEDNIATVYDGKCDPTVSV